MTIRNAIGEGVRRLWAAPRVLWIFYVATTIPALLATGILLSIAQDSLGHSAWTHALGTNLDASWFSELAAQHGSIVAAPFPIAIMGALAIFAVVYVLLLGGALEALCAGGRFFAGAGTHFWRLVRLLIFAAIFSIPVFLLNGLLNKIGEKAWGDGSAATPLVYWGWFRTAVLVALLGLLNLTFEYGAIHLVVEDSRKAWRALIAAIRLIARHPVKTIGLYLMLSIALLLVMAAGLGVSRAAAQTSAAAVLLLFLFHQAAVLVKTWTWLLFFPAQAAIWQSMREAPPEPAVVELPEPAAEPSADAGDIAIAP